MSKIKLLKASSFYTQYLDIFRHKYSGNDLSTYSLYYRKLMDDGFGWADFWKLNLERSGDFEIEEVVVNAETLQKLWAEEKSVKYDRENWALDILEARIDSFLPDIFFAHDFGIIKNEFRLKIKKKYPRMKIICWDGVAINNKDRFAGCDLMLTCLESTRKYYQEAGIHSSVMNFGFEKSILRRLRLDYSKYDFSFVGGINLNDGLHRKRFELLSELAKKMKPSYFLSGRGMTDHRLYQWPQRQRFLKGKFSEMLNIRRIGNYNLGSAFGMEMYQALADSRITLNIHIDGIGEQAANMRLVEATGVGTCLLTDWKENIVNFFEPGKEIVTFKSPAECAEKIRYLLNNETERKKIAMAGHIRTITHYSYEKRIGEILPVIKELIN